MTLLHYEAALSQALLLGQTHLSAQCRKAGESGAEGRAKVVGLIECTCRQIVDVFMHAVIHDCTIVVVF